MNNTKCEDSLVTVAGGSIYVKKWIPEKLRSVVPIMLIHDSLGSVAQWRDFPERLAVKLSRVVFSYDRLGFGRSSTRAEVLSAEFIWEEADIYFPQLITALSLDRYILFGHSVGGAMSIAIAAKDQNCIAVIAEASQAFVEDRTIAGIKAAQVLFQNPNQFKKLKKWHGIKSEWVLSVWTRVWLSAEFASWSLESRIGDVQCPTLVMHGDKDEFGSSAFPEFISEKIGGDFEMVIFDDCGHVPHREKLQEVLDLTLSFIKEHNID